jgi:hypothetical protein
MNSKNDLPIISVLVRCNSLPVPYLFIRKQKQKTYFGKDMTMEVTLANLKEKIYCDQISKCKQGFIFRRGFFYTNGGTSEKFKNNIVKQLTEKGFTKFVVVDSGEKWTTFKGGASLTNLNRWWVIIRKEN